MSISNYDRVGKAMEALRAGLAPYVLGEFKSVHRDRAEAEAVQWMGDDRINAKKPVLEWDVSVLLKLMWEAWNSVFKYALGPAERSLVSELRDSRNKWAHQQQFSSEDAYRALDSAYRLLTAVSAPQAEEVDRLKADLLRVIMDEQVRNEKRKAGGSLIESAAASGLKPWREVVSPHRDVASGRYRQAEFAADLWQVHLGEGGDEYKDPAEFFRRTFLTASLKGLLSGAIRRLSGGQADPVVQLQTNFGGGKTHSMLALYHLFSGAPPSDLPGIAEVMQDAEASKLPTARRVVLVGNKISPGNPSRKSDGTLVRTLWGELAWQLGGKAAYARIAADDEKATNPGDALRLLFNEYGPVLVLVDEWVAYARGLHDDADLPGGSFETQFSFAQALTESAKLAGKCLLVISLPASDTAVSPHAQAADAEVGGQRGRDALLRLQHVIGRIESSWRPATAEESFEIVRRRLFEPIANAQLFRDRDVVVRSFGDFYRAQQQEFPQETRDAAYEARIKAAYPIHPEVFDRLYEDWSTLLKFQRTRGVLRLMAAVIHSLWENGDRNPLIMPANIAIDDPRIESELARYLPDNWLPVIEKDVDGPASLPWKIDADLPNLGKHSACRRVARAIYLGSAPASGASNRGLDDRRIKLGCVLPGETPAVFGDALRRLAASATFLYQDDSRYWYSTQATVTKMAEDRAEQLLRNPDRVAAEVDRRVRADARQTGDFSRIHPMPRSGHEVPDDPDTRLVILSMDRPYAKETGNPAETEAMNILESRGNAPRVYRNALVFAAIDRSRVQDLDQATRSFLAWESILEEKDQLDLSPHQVRQAQAQRDRMNETVDARLPEAYQWLLVPAQPDPREQVRLSAVKMTGQDSIAARASKKLKAEELLIVSFAPTLLRMELDRVPLWRGDHVEMRQLAEDFARYAYLPRLRDGRVLAEAVREGAALLTWEKESFAVADSYDSEASRYRGLRAGSAAVSVDPGSQMLIVKPEAAAGQLERDRKPARIEIIPRETSVKPGAETPFVVKGYDPDGRETRVTGAEWTATGGVIGSDGTFKAGSVEGAFRIGVSALGFTDEARIIVSESVETVPPVTVPPRDVRPTRFHGSVALDPFRSARDAGIIADEVISHLTGINGSKVKVVLEIEATLPDGFTETTVRTVTENARTLKFDAQGFERE